MTEQIQNPARLVKPRIPGTTDQHVIEARLMREMRAALHGGKTKTHIPRVRSAHGLTHPQTYTTLAGYDQRTPHGIKVLKARRAKNKVAKQSRKVNR